MKMVKKFLSASVIAAMALSVGMIANAEEVDTTVTADAITIDSIAFSAHETDDTLVTATVAFTAVDTAEEVTILMSTTADVSDNADIMYINQVAQPEDGVITFAIEKARILASTEGTDVNGTTMYVKMGGTDIDTMASDSEEISLGLVGDFDKDQYLTSSDATYMLRAMANWPNYTQTDAMDLDKDTYLTSSDATYLLRAMANWPNYKL